MVIFALAVVAKCVTTGTTRGHYRQKSYRLVGCNEEREVKSTQGGGGGDMADTHSTAGRKGRYTHF